MGEFLKAAGGYYQKAKPFLETAAPYVAAGATVAGAALPLLFQDDDIEIPEYQTTTAQDIESDAAEKANQRRRTLATRRGQQSTIRTPLGAAPTLGVRTDGIRGY